MTAKDKAKELVEKYATWSWNENVCDYEVAKQCALYAVDEIIQEIKQINRVAFDNKDVFIQVNIKYWQEVKTEIQNL